MRSISSIYELDSFIDYKFDNIVLVGNSKISLSRYDEEFIKSLGRPLFVYINSAFEQNKIQKCYPSDFREILILRKKESGYHGVKEGILDFIPANKNFFCGIILIHVDDSPILGGWPIVKLSDDLYKLPFRDYPENEFQKMSPTSGYIAEIIFKELKKNSCSSDVSPTFLYTIGFGLDATVPRSKTHNIKYEQEQQAVKFQNGILRRIGSIAVPYVPLSER